MGKNEESSTLGPSTVKGDVLRDLIAKRHERGPFQLLPTVPTREHGGRLAS